MAGGFLYQRLAGVSRSTSRLSGHASASARATAPITPRASEAGITTLSNVFHGAAVHPGTAVPSNRGLHGCAARYLSTFQCSRASAKTVWSTTGMPPSIINQKKSSFLNSVGVKRTCSSGASNKLKHSWEAELADWRARDASLKAYVSKENNAHFIVVWSSVYLFIITSFLPCERTSRASSDCCNCNCMADGSES